MHDGVKRQSFLHYHRKHRSVVEENERCAVSARCSVFLILTRVPIPERRGVRREGWECTME